jgi:hypothetical protein
VKVIIESNLHITDVFEPPMELHVREGAKLRDLLLELTDRYVSIKLLNEKGQLDADIEELTINDKDFFTFKNGLNTRLNEGDRIRFQIQMVQIGGG